MKTYKSKLTIVSILAVLLSTLSFCISVIAETSFNISFTWYVVNASNANDVKIAKKELDKAITYLERQNLTSGNSSILWTNFPDNDLSSYYNTLKIASLNLDKLSNDKSIISKSSEKTDDFLKIKNALAMAGEQKPFAIYFYPYQNVIFITTIIIIPVLYIIVVCLFFNKLTKKEHNNLEMSL